MKVDWLNHLLVLLLRIFFVAKVSQGFSTLAVPIRKRPITALSTTASATVDDLLNASDGNNNKDARALLYQLEETFSQSADKENNNLSRFDPLLGLYNVSGTFTTRQGDDNPVGGKWTRSNGLLQKVLQTTATWQHLIPTSSTTTTSSVDNSGFVTPNNIVAEAVNHIRLEAFNKLFPIHVLLRGDVVPLTCNERTNTSRVVRPLSALAVKVLFDSPLICFGKRWTINVGPKTSVLLDTTYCDDRVRIGMGGTSGTRFVFTRSESSGASEYKSLLQQRPIAKAKVLLGLGLAAIFGGCVVRQGWRLLGGMLTMTSVLLGSIVAFSGGGIERDDQSIRLRQEYEEGKSALPDAKPGKLENIQPKYVSQKLDDEELKKKYASIENIEDRAYQILLDLEMI